MNVEKTKLNEITVKLEHWMDARKKRVKWTQNTKQ